MDISTKKNYWENKSYYFYRSMIKRHYFLRSFIDRFITLNDVKSILEVGGGNTPYNNAVADYCGIDINTILQESYQEKYKDQIYIAGDFTKMDVSHLKRYDLLLSLATIEHCNNWKDFIQKVKEVNAKYSIISFFNNLLRNVTRNGMVKNECGEYPLWKFSKTDIKNRVNEVGIKRYLFIEIPCLSNKQKVENLLIVYGE